jgi:hypothetical protein
MNGLAALVVFLVGTVAVVALFVTRGVRRRRKKKVPPVNLQSFRDENFGTQTFRDENFGALSPNGNTLFPAFSMDIVEGARAHDAQLYDVEFC